MDRKTSSPHSGALATPATPTQHGVRTPDQWDDRWAPPEFPVQQVPILQVPAQQWQVQQGLMPVAVPISGFSQEQPTTLAQQASLAKRIAELESQLGASETHNRVLEARLRVAQLEAELGNSEAVSKELETKYTELESSRPPALDETQDEFNTCSLQTEASKKDEILVLNEGNNTEPQDTQAETHTAEVPAELLAQSPETKLAAVTEVKEEDGMLEMPESRAAKPLESADAMVAPEPDFVHGQAPEPVPCPRQLGISSQIEQACAYRAELTEVAEPLPSAQAPQEDTEVRHVPTEATESKVPEPETMKRSKARKRNVGRKGVESAPKKSKEQVCSTAGPGKQFAGDSKVAQVSQWLWASTVLPVVSCCVALVCIAIFTWRHSTAVSVGGETFHGIIGRVDGSGNNNTGFISNTNPSTEEPAKDSKDIPTVKAESVISFGWLGDVPNKWWSGVVAPNGFIYGIPSSANAVLKIDPTSDAIKRFGKLDDQPFKWLASVVAKNGIIYGIPAAAGAVLRIDPYSDSITMLGKFSKLESKWTSAVLTAGRSHIYGIPNSAASVLKIDTVSDKIKTFGRVGTSKYKWSSGVLAKNGAIYGIPANVDAVLKIDPDSDNVTLIGSLTTQRNKWFAGVQSRNGAIYGIPNSAQSVLKIDTTADTLSFLGELDDAPFKYMSGVVARNGMIYGIPFAASSILVINPAADTVEVFGTIKNNGSMWRSANLGVDGEIFAMPFNASEILVIDPSSQTFRYCGSFDAGSKWRFGATAPSGYLYGIPVSADSVLKIDTSRESTCRRNLPVRRES